jgi:chromosome partitioning protein
LPLQSSNTSTYTDNVSINKVPIPSAADHLSDKRPARYTQPMVISVASQKGGTGKTTTSIALAAGLARQGRKVLLVDVDSQANSSKVLVPDYAALTKDETVYATILQRQALPIRPTSVPNVDIAPSHILLSNTDVELTTAKDHREARLRRELDQVKARYDHVLIDCPPALSWLTLNAFTASDKVLVIVSPGYFELDSIVQISKTITEVQEYFNPTLSLLGYLFTMSDPTINTAASLRILRQTYTNQVLHTIIPRNTDIRDAHFNKQDIFTFNEHAKSAQAYARLIEEIFA